MKTMTEKEKKLSELYKKYQHAKRRLEMGKENRDYAAMIAELEWQMNELMGNNISDGIVALKKIGSTDGITNYIVLLVEKKNEIGRITYKTKDMVGLLNYKFDENAPKMGYDLRAIKLVIEQMGKHSNIILLDDTNIIIDSLRHIKEIDENYRDIQKSKC